MTKGMDGGLRRVESVTIFVRNTVDRVGRWLVVRRIGVGRGASPRREGTATVGRGTCGGVISRGGRATVVVLLLLLLLQCTLVAPMVSATGEAGCGWFFGTVTR